MDSELLLGCIVILLIVLVVLLSVLIHKVSEGFRITFNYLDSLKHFECHYPEPERYSEDYGEEPH